MNETSEQRSVDFRMRFPRLGCLQQAQYVTSIRETAVDVSNSVGVQDRSNRHIINLTPEEACYLLYGRQRVNSTFLMASSSKYGLSFCKSYFHSEERRDPMT